LVVRCGCVVCFKLVWWLGWLYLFRYTMLVWMSCGGWSVVAVGLLWCCVGVLGCVDGL